MNLREYLDERHKLIRKAIADARQNVDEKHYRFRKAVCTRSPSVRKDENLLNEAWRELRWLEGRRDEANQLERWLEKQEEHKQHELSLNQWQELIDSQAPHWASGPDAEEY